MRAHSKGIVISSWVYTQTLAKEKEGQPRHLGWKCTWNAGSLIRISLLLLMLSAKQGKTLLLANTALVGESVVCL